MNDPLTPRLATCNMQRNTHRVSLPRVERPRAIVSQNDVEAPLHATAYGVVVVAPH